MALLLYALGRFAFRRRRLVALAWVALLVAVGFAAAAASGPINSPLTVPGTESQRAFDLIEQRFPGSAADGATARVLFQAPAGQRLTTSANAAAVQRVVGELRSGSPQVASVAGPFDGSTSGTGGGSVRLLAKDGAIAYAVVSYKTTATELTDATVNALKRAARDGRDTGLRVEIGGDALTPVPTAGPGEVVGLAITALVLMLTFGSLVAAGLPLVTALLGVAIGIAGISALGGVLHLSSSTALLALMIGLAVGIDYALFIVSRYRSELADGHQPEDAAGRALGTAGSAVVFAGLTVVVALAGLAVVNIPNLTKMGLAAAATVVVAVLVALTLIPALLGFAGRRVLPRKVRKGTRRLAAASDRARRGRRQDGLGARWAAFVLARPVSVLVAGVIGLAVLAVPAASLRMALPDDGHLPPDTTQRKAYDLLADGFGPGFNGPLTLTVDPAGRGNAGTAAARAISVVSALPGVAAVTPARLSSSGDTAMISVVPASGPNDTATKDLVTAIRKRRGDLRSATGAQVLVTGRTALNIDIAQRLGGAVPPYLALVSALAFLILLVVFRSLVVPLKAAVGFLLSVLASLGVIVAVFQWGWLGSVLGVKQTGPINSTMPIFLIGVVFGLAMDYEVFLVSRMREAYTEGAEPRAAITAGFAHNARVVTAGALIMISVFAGFVGSSEAMIKMLGFGLGVAVLLDAFVVRMAVVPAALALLGRAAWWLPRRLAAILPDLDIEGTRLHDRPGEDAAAHDPSLARM
ncbi:MMPL family transporter [Actinomadura nitritigenes]|uniref:MMPL family transporter n=1 Tax=Actinomadura nitritigenes TaxID=134602 RepID=A0ABS3RF25_9ACTN|nr:MMPL family transporter [Actinomadura nitritigenes]MBO2444846.1 MMPL family transporter [Actinomadura nitritigenes]